MTRPVFISSDNIFSPIGFTTGENIDNLKNNISGIKQHSGLSMSEQTFFASLFADNNFPPANGNTNTKFEQLLIASVSNALKNSPIDPSDSKTILIISSTKGNISLLETEPHHPETYKRIAMHQSARLVAEHFGFVHNPVVISNACISGILALLTGMRLIQSGQYDHAVVAGADCISRFVLSGFQSFQAVSQQVCKPFDANRNGINLGEGAACIVLSSQKEYSTGTLLAGGAVSNDANHISGPSRTGEELYFAINKAMKDADVSSGDIDFISAHGTATIYNDEMEAKAINLAGLQKVPVNSLKGFYGHTLGAAGIIETVVSNHSLMNNIIFPTPGFTEMGVPTPVNVCSQLTNTNLSNILKTASGFGGCNAALILKKQ